MQQIPGTAGTGAFGPSDTHVPIRNPSSREHREGVAPSGVRQGEVRGAVLALVHVWESSTNHHHHYWLELLSGELLWCTAITVLVCIDAERGRWMCDPRQVELGVFIDSNR